MVRGFLALLVGISPALGVSGVELSRFDLTWGYDDDNDEMGLGWLPGWTEVLLGKGMWIRREAGGVWYGFASWGADYCRCVFSYHQGLLAGLDFSSGDGLRESVYVNDDVLRERWRMMCDRYAF